MHNQNPGDVFEENVASAAQTLTLLESIVSHPGSSSASDDEGNVLCFLSPNGAVRLERSGDCLILDIAPHTKLGNALQDHSYRLEASAFPGSPIFARNSKLSREGLDCLKKSIASLGDTVSLDFYNDGRMKHGILAHVVKKHLAITEEMHRLIDGACQAIAAMIPQGRALHYQSAAFGAPARLRIISEHDRMIHDEARNQTVAGMRIADVEPYLSLMPEVMFLRPDADNPNTVVLQPMAMTYAPPADRAQAIMRLTSIIIRLRILAAQITGKVSTTNTL